MVPIARAADRAGRGRLAVYRQLNTYRGWDEARTPVEDTLASLTTLTERFPHVPVGLIGHSLGGRTAIESGSAFAVSTVAVLNPWLYPDDDADLTGRRVLFVHGGRDKVASPADSARVARRLARRTSVGYVTIPDGQHAMLKHGRSFDRIAAEFTAAILLQDPSIATGPVAKVLAGEEWVTE
jgi:dienelactone hydrolase